MRGWADSPLTSIDLLAGGGHRYTAASMPRIASATADVIVEPTAIRTRVEDAVVNFAAGRLPAILESSLQRGPYARFSILACDPVEVITLSEVDAEFPLDTFAKCVSRYPTTSADRPDLPFTGAWIGHVSYEAGLTIEQIKRTTRRDVGLPQLRFALYDTAAVFDHDNARWFLVAVSWPKRVLPNRSDPGTRMAELRSRLLENRGRFDLPQVRPCETHLGTRPGSPTATHPSRAPLAGSRTNDAVANMSYADYVERVRRAKRYIEAGDIYQVNLTQRFTARTKDTPVELYRRLRRESPSSHAALLIWDDRAVISSSPELFLELRGGRVVTRPIKGTRARGGDPAEDGVRRRELAESEKDRAELNMIVDLLRNDLGRVCSFGSVRVVHPGEIEEHPTVFHRVATIEGTLDPRRDWLDLLKATFPGGSVTGVPKIRAMQIIDELEPTERGVYCGSIGMIGLDGSISLNIAIRTMVQTGRVVHLHAGGAIVADSQPEAEYEEVLAKAAAMLRAVERGGGGRLRADQEVTVP